MKHLFLSYSRKDTDVMIRVRDTLRAEGFEVWTDEKLTPGTDQWNQALEQAFANSFAVVVLLSPDSKGSQWVRNEISYANTHGLLIFPILIRGEERDSVPIQLINVQRIDIRTRFLAQMQELVDIMRDHLQSLEVVDIKPVQTIKTLGKSLSETEIKRNQFWRSLIERSKSKTDLFVNIKPGYDHWISTSAGKSKVNLFYIVAKDYGSVELYIDHGTQDQNKKIFDTLFADKAQIEAEFGEPLQWMRLDNKRASRIAKNFYKGGLDSPDSWDELQDLMIERMIVFDKIFRSRLTMIKV